MALNLLVADCRSERTREEFPIWFYPLNFQQPFSYHNSLIIFGSRERKTFSHLFSRKFVCDPIRSKLIISDFPTRKIHSQTSE